MTTPDRRSVLKTIGTGAIAFTTGVGTATAHDDSDDGENGKEARVRVAHASPDAPAVDVYVDTVPDHSDPTIPELTFTEVTEYLPIPEGEHEITITAADSPDPVPPTPVTVDLCDDAYTVAAIGELSPEGDEAEFTVDVFEDDLSPLEEETGRVSTYHAVPDAPAVDVRVTDGPTLASDLSFGMAGPNAEIAAGTYSVGVFPAGSHDPVIEPLDVEVREGQLLTVFAMGTLDPDDGEPEIQPVPAYAETGSFDTGRGEGQARVRVAHASPDAPAVDVYVDAVPHDDDPTIPELEFTEVTEYLPIAEGEHDVTITTAGSADPVPPTPVTVDLCDDAYTVAAIGELSPEDDEAEFTVGVFEDNLGRLDEGTGRVRAYHAVPDAPAVDVRVRDGPTLASDLAFGMAGPNADVQAGTYPVAVFPAGSDEAVFGPDHVEVRAGQVLTVFAMGNLMREDDEPEFLPVLAYEEAAPFGRGNGDGGDGMGSDGDGE